MLSMKDILMRYGQIEMGLGSITLPCQLVSFENRPFFDKSIQPEKRIDPHVITETELSGIDSELDGTMVIYHDTELQDDECRQQILSLDCNFCVWFTMDNVIREILSSYNENKNINMITPRIKNNILDQVNIDFPRCEIFINSNRCTKIDFLSFCQKYKKYSHPIMGSLENLLLMLSTQASFYYPYSIVNKIYTTADTGMHVVSTTDFNSDTSFEDGPFINIVDNGRTIDIVFKKIFKHLDINDVKVVNRFHTFMVVTIKMFNKLVGHEIAGACKCDTGIMYWLKQNK